MDYTLADDATLLRIVAQKRPEALEALYDRYGNLVFSVALAIIRDRGLAEEIMQDVFWRVWDNAEIYDQSRAQVKHWLMRMARNRAIDQARKDRLRPERHASPWAEPTLRQSSDHHTPLHIMAFAAEQARVRAALADLPEDQQRALQLAYLQGYSHQEIAEHLREPLGTIKTRIRLGMQKLRQLLRDP
jgi:RNA polymerase sigma-70 factor, ECF subfamily